MALQYDQEEIEELRHTFNSYDTNKNGHLNVSEVQKCVSDLSYNYSEKFLKQVMEGQAEAHSEGLTFEEFVNFVDVISAIDGFVYEHCQQVLEAVDPGQMKSIQQREGISDKSELISKLSPLVGLQGEDEFDFSVRTIYNAAVVHPYPLWNVFVVCVFISWCRGS